MIARRRNPATFKDTPVWVWDGRRFVPGRGDSLGPGRVKVTLPGRQKPVFVASDKVRPRKAGNPPTGTVRVANPDTKNFIKRELMTDWRRKLDPRSIRTKTLKGGLLLRIGCPKGYWRPRKQRCRKGTRALSLLIPRRLASNAKKKRRRRIRRCW
jgi:hypothetical protein